LYPIEESSPTFFGMSPRGERVGVGAAVLLLLVEGTVGAGATDASRGSDWAAGVLFPHPTSTTAAAVRAAASETRFLGEVIESCVFLA
jgi:hypothetical protein